MSEKVGDAVELFYSSPHSIMKIDELNHVALLVRDVEASCRFYREVIGLKSIPRPGFSFPGAWFRIGSVQELHLIEGVCDGAPDDSGRRDHFALKVADVDEAAKHLRERGAAFLGPVPPSNGTRQIFMRDPDGHVL